MSDTITLTLRSALDTIVEAESIVPDRFAALSNAEIAHLPVWRGREQLALGDLFDVSGERAARVHMVGELSMVDALGAAMSGGELTVEGNVGRYVGSRMSGGVLRVSGNAGDGAGLEMAGGLLDISGDAGNRVGAARLGASKGMLGGEIIVRGKLGAEAGTRMRRGTILCFGAGERTGEAMVAGTFVFAIMLVAYGVAPHQWQAYADNTLLWRADKLLVGVSTAGVVWGQKAKNLGGTGRIIVN